MLTNLQNRSNFKARKESKYGIEEVEEAELEIRQEMLSSTNVPNRPVRRPGGRTGRTAGGSPSFFESMDGLWKMRLGPDALRGPVGPFRNFLFLETSS